MRSFSHRWFRGALIAFAAALVLGASLAGSRPTSAAVGAPINLLPPIDWTQPDDATTAALPGEKQIDKKWWLTPVFYRSTQPVGTIIIDTSARYLYLITGQNKALRYGIAVGRDGFQWQGAMRVTRKAEWPTWTPPADMIAREKKNGKILPAKVAGGPKNPLGARALYLGNSQYRIHGTNQPKSIGHAASSGCIRMLNDHVIDLYKRVPVGTRVIVMR